MADSDDLDGPDAALLDRLRTGVSGIQPRHDALAVVRHHVGRRRRRRRVVAVVASVAAAAVVVPVALLALQLQGDDGGVPPADGPTTGAAVLDGTRPVAFFVDNAGGRARGQQTTYRAAAGERYYARFLWWPEADGRYPVFAGAAVAYVEGDADAACAALVAEDEAAGATSTCETTATGEVARIADTTAGAVSIDAANGRGKLDTGDPDDQVRAVTVFRDDGWAVSLVLCECSAWDGPDLDDPPLSGAELADIAAVEAWVPLADDAPRRGSGLGSEGN
ncbi:hypothetical protein [Nocardioides sp.]|uniref:hypothetical protein n=1 Tax=Nocardioides sp. TaxID=35761 RepID=UPI00271E79A5|nr:hypothetical protein [Nocardioides sp.]MDO9455594.1 hypothetical protein [Nocardioides sp.]